VKIDRAIQDTFRALARRDVLAILLLIADEPRTVRQVAEGLGIQRGTANRWLTTMESSGLITHTAREQRERVYALAPHITADEESLHIDIMGLPVAIGRHLKEKS